MSVIKFLKVVAYFLHVTMIWYCVLVLVLPVTVANAVFLVEELMEGC